MASFSLSVAIILLLYYHESSGYRLAHVRSAKSPVFFSLKSGENNIDFDDKPLKSVVPLSPYSASKAKSILLLRGAALSWLAISSVLADDSLSSNSQSTAKSIFLLKSDEISINIEDDYLGLGLVESEYKDRLRVVISSVKDNAPANIQQSVKPGMIVVAINDIVVEGVPTQRLFPMIKGVPRPFQLVVRDPSLFYQLLRTPRIKQPQMLSTTIVPSILAKDGREQVLIVTTIPNTSPAVNTSLIAHRGDVLEVVHSACWRGKEIDSSTDDITLASPFTSSSSLLRNDSIFFVLGAGKSNSKYSSFATSEGSVTIKTGFDASVGGILNAVTPNWDSLLQGMLVGDKRVLQLPPAYFRNEMDVRMLEKVFGDESNVRNDVTPLELTIVLLSINGRMT